MKRAVAPGCRGIRPAKFAKARCDSRVRSRCQKETGFGRRAPTIGRLASAPDRPHGDAHKFLPELASHDRRGEIPGWQKPARAESSHHATDVVVHKDQRE